MTTARAQDPPLLARRARAVGASPVREILALTARPEVVSFAGGLPAPELFDARGLRDAFDRVLAERPGVVLQYSTTEGDPALRAAVAGRLTGKGLPTGPDDLLVTGGSQQGLSLIATALLEPGDVVLVENPTYLAALQCFGFAGARVVPVPTDEDGVVPEALADLVRREHPKLLYLIPNFQNPTGRTLPPARRRAVADVAARYGLWIAEDDPYGELRFEGGPVPPVEYRYATFTYPEVSANYVNVDSRAFPRSGTAGSLTLRGGIEGAGSDANFAQVHAQARWFKAIGASDRFILRGELGHTFTDALNAMPPSLRYYAGGDRSIRGYQYREVGPRIETDEGKFSVGAKNVITGSAEYEHYFNGSWGGAVFVDSGSAFDGTDIEWRTGVGVGVRWKSPVGAVRVDLARGLNDPDSSFTIGLGIGAEF